MLEIRQKASFATIFCILFNLLSEFSCREAQAFAEPAFTRSCTMRQQKRTDRFDSSADAQMKFRRATGFALPP
ncbi:hypothetical protein CIT25_03875 [Mesorhizobium mediterraneum]|uniref:Secreted protein n=1 Tax=Mesorhizobium mediterraneum TaxID=43617 RepID=A0AB36RGB4_9HYPH|nr:hypothetical protein CIT25_03875 [Mesorhizobium mediterraneum]